MPLQSCAREDTMTTPVPYNDGDWSALQGNTLKALATTREERGVMYVRRRANAKTRKVRKIKKALDVAAEKEETAFTRWKPRTCKVLINPADWGKSSLHIARFKDSKEKQNLLLSTLDEATKRYLPSHEALRFPIPIADDASPEIRDCAQETMTVEDDDGQKEFRYGHLIFTLTGNYDGKPYCTEVACKSTSERDCWVQLFQDFMIIAEMDKIRKVGSTAFPPDTGNQHDEFPAEKWGDPLRVFFSGMKDDDLDSLPGGCGLSVDKPPEHDLRVRLPKEDRLISRRIKFAGEPGCVLISNPRNLKGFVSGRTTRVILDLTRYIIRVELHDFNVFTFISVTDPHDVVKLEVVGRKEEKKARDKWLSWLLFVKAAKSVANAEQQGLWRKATELQSGSLIFVENVADDPRLAYPSDRFPTTSGWREDLDEQRRKCYRRSDGRLAAVVNLPQGRLARIVAYDINEVFQQTADETVGFTHPHDDVDDAQSLAPQVSANPTPKITITSNTLYRSETTLYNVAPAVKEYVPSRHRKVARLPAPWEALDSDSSADYSADERALPDGKPVNFRSWMLSGETIEHWRQLPKVTVTSLPPSPTVKPDVGFNAHCDMHVLSDGSGTDTEELAQDVAEKPVLNRSMFEKRKLGSGIITLLDAAHRTLRNVSDRGGESSGRSRLFSPPHLLTQLPSPKSLLRRPSAPLFHDPEPSPHQGIRRKSQTPLPPTHSPSSSRMASCEAISTPFEDHLDIPCTQTIIVPATRRHDTLQPSASSALHPGNSGAPADAGKPPVNGVTAFLDKEPWASLSSSDNADEPPMIPSEEGDKLGCPFIPFDETTQDEGLSATPLSPKDTASSSEERSRRPGAVVPPASQRRRGSGASAKQRKTRKSWRSSGGVSPQRKPAADPPGKAKPGTPDGTLSNSSADEKAAGIGAAWKMQSESGSSNRARQQSQLSSLAPLAPPGLFPSNASQDPPSRVSKRTLLFRKKAPAVKDLMASDDRPHSPSSSPVSKRGPGSPPPSFKNDPALAQQYQLHLNNSFSSAGSPRSANGYHRLPDSDEVLARALRKTKVPEEAMKQVQASQTTPTSRSGSAKARGKGAWFQNGGGGRPDDTPPAKKPAFDNEDEVLSPHSSWGSPGIPPIDPVRRPPASPSQRSEKSQNGLGFVFPGAQARRCIAGSKAKNEVLLEKSPTTTTPTTTRGEGTLWRPWVAGGASDFAGLDSSEGTALSYGGAGNGDGGGVLHHPLLNGSVRHGAEPRVQRCWVVPRRGDAGEACLAVSTTDPEGLQTTQKIRTQDIADVGREHGHEDAGKAFRVVLTTGSVRKFVFRCPSEADCSDWVAKIKRMVRGDVLDGEWEAGGQLGLVLAGAKTHSAHNPNQAWVSSPFESLHALPAQLGGTNSDGASLLGPDSILPSPRDVFAVEHLERPQHMVLLPASRSDCRGVLSPSPRDQLDKLLNRNSNRQVAPPQYRGSPPGSPKLAGPGRPYNTDGANGPLHFPVASSPRSPLPASRNGTPQLAL
ncbi:hypothetical protein DIPPA_13984 [Diplonema papillatum]|nr:hypothetical protein DIPPA_13984 [Diplonema papillatum]